MASCTASDHKIISSPSNPGDETRIFHRMRYLLLAGFLALAELSQGQQSIRGVVRDAETHEALVGVHVLGFTRYVDGTSTNGDGQFTLQLHDWPDSVRITCIGYRSQTLLRKDYQRVPLEVNLQPNIIPLQALVVKPVSAEQLIREGVRAITRNYSTPPFQLRGFYREMVRNGTLYYSVAEAVFENQLLKKNDEGLLKLIQGRRSETVQSTRIFEDYHPGGGPNFLVNNILENQLPDFLQEGNLGDYVFSIDSITSYDGQDVFQVGFDQRDNLHKNLWTGVIYIAAESKAIIELAYSLSNKGLEYRKHLSGTDKVMAELLGIDYTVNRKAIRYSYHRSGERWALHDASLTMDIHFVEPRKNIDEPFTFQAELLALRQAAGPLTPFPKSDQWRRNQLVMNLPGEFDERFWGEYNIIQPERSLTDAVASMDVLRADNLPSDSPGGWNLFHASEAKAYQRDSTFILKPYLESRWKDKDQGPFLWQNVSGNFEIYGRLAVTKTIDTAAAPDAGFQVGGLMIRAPRDEPENHILFAFGSMGNPTLKLIQQNTINGRSAIHVTRVGWHTAALRIRRLGNKIELHYLPPETHRWVLAREIQRGDLPETLQVGLAGYAWVPGEAPNRHPDLLIQAHGLRIKALP